MKLKNYNNKFVKKFSSIFFLLLIVILTIVISGCRCDCLNTSTPGIVTTKNLLVVGEGMDYKTPQEAVKDCQDGDSILIMEGAYEFDKAVELFEKNNVTITGRGNVELICNNMEDNVMWIVTCNNIEIKNIKARHTNPTKNERCYGNVFALDMSTDVTIEDCDINGCGAIGVYILGGGKILLRNNHIHNNSLWAVQLNGIGYLHEAENLEGLRFAGNVIENNGFGRQQ